MNDITIRFAVPTDGAALAALIDAMDRYYRDSERPADETRAAVEAWFRDGASDARFVLGFAGNQPLGFASFAVLHPGRALRGTLFLKALFVVAECRGQGIGERIMQFLAGFCASHDIGHIDWVVETASSQHFYERLGATLQPQKRVMRLDGQALADLAGK
jgi:GNAT superfamily N-acetyltransferase